MRNPSLTQREKLALLRSAALRGRRAGASTAARFAVDGSRTVRIRALEALSVNGDVRWIRVATAALADTEDTVVVTAIECLVSWEARRSVAKIVALLDSESELTRTHAAWALGKLGSTRHVPLLTRRLRRLDDQVEGSALAEALYMLTRKPRYLRHLLEQLGSTDPDARAFTTNSLVGVADSGNFAPIVCALAKALAVERNESVLPSLRRDLEEVVALAIGWKSAPSRRTIRPSSTS